MERPRQVQLLAVALAGACIVPAGLIQERRATRSDLEEVIPGRAFVVTYLWMRADQLKDQGRYYDAMQLAQMICRLQKRFPSVWAFHAWNMGWNISVATHTPEQRWRWVHNAVRLLRDEAIPLNRTSLLLYKELGWIYLFKIGGFLDDMHWVYKRQWATRMQDLLGAPPQGDSEEAIAAFRPVAEAPLDTDPARQGAQVIQADMLRKVLADRRTKEYADMLARRGIGVDRSLLAAYNRYSLEPPVAVVRVLPPVVRDDRDADLARLINDPLRAGARGRLLAFVRAQVLWNVYRMDPRWMLAMMEQYGPLDWRLPQPHGLYWFTYGRHVCQSKSLGDVDSLNTDRNVFNCLKELTWWGRLTMVDRRPRDEGADVLSLEAARPTSDMQLPRVELYVGNDVRFVAATHAEFLRTIQAVTRGIPARFAHTPFRDGHVNYLDTAICMLYAGYRRGEAQHYYDWVKAKYAPDGSRWKQPDVEDFVLDGLRGQQEPSMALASSQIDAALAAALVGLARGQQAVFDDSTRYARRVHDSYQQRVNPRRAGLPPLNHWLTRAAAVLLLNPRSAGYNLSLADRSEMYRALPPAVQQEIFPPAERQLRGECEIQRLDFPRAFPAPAGTKPPSAPEGGAGEP